MSSTIDLKSMTIADILAEYPQTQPVFQQYGLVGYAGTKTAQHENLQASALVHNVELNALVSALTNVIAG